ncbi:MAG: DUF2147 domain-containing protein [Pseudomonadota bacterium]
MKKTLKFSTHFLLFFLLSIISVSSYAASPLGNWKTIDDVTGNVKSIVRIEGSASNLTGTVVKLYPGAMTICSECSGNLKDKQILGMTVISGLKQNADEPNEWSGGTIMDPKTGKTYHCTITVSADGSKLNVRGYIGFSLLGRTQTWIKVSGK